MIYGNIDEMAAYPAFQQHPVWRTAFEELTKVTPSSPLGTYQTHRDGCFVKVLQYRTIPRVECRYETHRNHVDLQYVISGGELIDWETRGNLQPSTPFDVAGDIQFYAPRSPSTVLSLTTRHFAIFFPTDAHRPQVQNGVNDSVFKVVVKIQLDLL